MAKSATIDNTLRKGAKVTAAVDLRDVPEGTPGKVILKNGFSWIRYWVRFDNGVSLGSLDRTVLVTAADLAGVGAATADAGASASTGEAAAADGGDGGGVATPSGTLVPQKLLDRAAAARTRLAG